MPRSTGLSSGLINETIFFLLTTSFAWIYPPQPFVCIRLLSLTGATVCVCACVRACVRACVCVFSPAFSPRLCFRGAPSFCFPCPVFRLLRFPLSLESVCADDILCFVYVSLESVCADNRLCCVFVSSEYVCADDLLCSVFVSIECVCADDLLCSVFLDGVGHSGLSVPTSF